MFLDSLVSYNSYNYTLNLLSHSVVCTALMSTGFTAYSAALSNLFLFYPRKTALTRIAKSRNTPTKGYDTLVKVIKSNRRFNL